MAQELFEDQADKEWLRSQTVAILGYGNQGHAQAQNLRDQGIRVVIGSRKNSKNGEQAELEGFEVLAIEEATARAGVVMMTTPDVPMAQIFKESVEPSIRPGTLLLVCHGFSVHFGGLTPAQDIDVALVGPKGPGKGLRQTFLNGKNLPSLIAVHQDSTGYALPRTLAYAWGIGCSSSLMLQTTFAEECETDLFGEQAVLCGGIPALVKLGFDTLVARGYDPEVAYFECLHEVRLIVDLLVDRGLSGMREAISDTACYGGLFAGEQVIGSQAQASMENVLNDIRSGDFARAWIEEFEDGSKDLLKRQQVEAESAIEAVGAKIRSRLN